MNPGTPFSLVLIAIGGVLTWGIDDRVDVVNLAAIGVILMIVGVIGLVMSLAFWNSVFGTSTWANRRGTTVYHEEPRTTVYRDAPPAVIVERAPTEEVYEHRERVVTRDESTLHPR